MKKKIKMMLPLFLIAVITFLSLFVNITIFQASESLLGENQRKVSIEMIMGEIENQNSIILDENKAREEGLHIIGMTDTGNKIYSTMSK